MPVDVLSFLDKQKDVLSFLDNQKDVLSFLDNKQKEINTMPQERISHTPDKVAPEAPTPESVRSLSTKLPVEEKPQHRHLDIINKVRKSLFPVLTKTEMEDFARLPLNEKYKMGAPEAMGLSGGIAMSRLLKKAVKPKFVDDALKVEQMFDRATAESKKLRKFQPKKIWSALKRSTVDVSGNVKKKLLEQGDEGKTAVMHKDLIAGSSSKATRDFEQASFKIFKGLDPVEHEYLDRVIQSRRTLVVSGYKPGIKNPEGLTKQHVDWLEQLPPELNEKLNVKANEYFGEMRKVLDNLYNEGLITKESYEALASKGDYSPRVFLKHIDPEVVHDVGGRKISVSQSGIKPIKEGDYGLLEKDSSLLLANAMTRSQTRIFRNRANTAMMSLAEQVPDNGIVRLAKEVGEGAFEKAGKGETEIYAMVKGVKRRMIMPDEMAKEWVKNDPAINQSLATTLGWLSGAKILRPMATGLNPEFALTNFPRDLAHIWLTTGEYSPTAPKAFAQIGRDILAVTKDAFRRKGRFNEYINEGGGMDFLTHQGRFQPKGHGTLEKAQEIMGYLGETSEIVGRLALRERALRNGLSKTEATWIARNYLDFNQGGSFAKAVDSAVPYLNASIQGTRGIFRAAGNNPKVFTYKVAQVGALASSLYMANKHHNPEAWDSVHPREKVNNWIITTPFSYKDKQGNDRHVYFKIAKDQGQRVMATVFENMMAKYNGDQVDADQIVSSIEDALPIMPESAVPPTLEAFLGYSLNKDFWRKEDIWRGPEVEPREEWSLYTHPAFIQFGQASGMSPERTKTALSQFFTSGNIYTSMVGYGWKQAFDEMPEIEKQKVTEELILSKPFIRKVVNETLPFNKNRKEMEQAKIQSNTERLILNRKFDIMVQDHFNGKFTKDEVKDFIRSQPDVDRKRLINRFKKSLKLKDVPDRVWWIKATNLSPEARALVYWNRWNNEPDSREMLSKFKTKVPGFNTKRFNKKLQSLQSKTPVEIEPVEEQIKIPEPVKESKDPLSFLDNKPKDKLADMEIETTAIRAKTGKKYKVKENAREAINRVDGTIEKLKKVKDRL